MNGLPSLKRMAFDSMSIFADSTAIVVLRGEGAVIVSGLEGFVRLGR
jgi:hypothetical protein